MTEAEWETRRQARLAAVAVPPKGKRGRPPREVRTVSGVTHLRCCRCGQWKATGSFYERRTTDSPVKFQNRCKPCDAELFQERRAKGFRQAKRWNGAKGRAA